MPFPSATVQSSAGRRKNYYQVRLSDISAEIVPENPGCPPGPYKCYLDVSVDTVHKCTRVSRREKYTWDETFEFSVREDWPICIQLLEKRTFCKDVLLASSGDWRQFPTSTQTEVVSRVLHGGVLGIYQVIVTWKLGLLDVHPIPDQLSPVHPEESFIEDVGELIAAPNPSSAEFRPFSRKVLRYHAIDFSCSSFSDSDGSSFVVSLHDFEDDSISSGSSSSSDDNGVLVSPVSDLPHKGGFSTNPDDAAKDSALGATLPDHAPNDNLNDMRLSRSSQAPAADAVDSSISTAKDPFTPTRRRTPLRTLSSGASKGRQAYRMLWRRVKSLFSWRKPRNTTGESHPRTHHT